MRFLSAMRGNMWLSRKTECNVISAGRHVSDAEVQMSVTGPGEE